MKDILNIEEKMTSLVIAELTGRKHLHLMRDIRKMEDAWVKLGQSKFGFTSYSDAQGKKRPMYELSKTECLYIATKFKDEARAKLVLRWEELEVEKQQANKLSPAEQLLKNAQLLVAQERKLTEHDNRLKELEAKTTTRPEYFTIAGFGSLNGYTVNVKIASKLGKEASKICKERGLLTDETPDPRFGKVKMYPSRVLSEVFNNVKV